MKTKIMKNTLIVLFTFFSFSAVVQAQEYVAAFQDKSSIDHESGVYEFYVNADEINEERVQSSSKYYTDYFSVKQKEEDGLRRVMVYLNQPGDDMSIKVIMRLMVTMGIEKVNYAGSEMNIQKFFNEYMNK